MAMVVGNLTNVSTDMLGVELTEAGIALFIINISHALDLQ